MSYRCEHGKDSDICVMCWEEKHLNNNRNMKTMTLDEQRIAIAEWVGYIEVKMRLHPLDDKTLVLSGFLGIKSYFQQIPNYPLDLNAMHEAEGKLSDNYNEERSQQLTYSLQLLKMVGYWKPSSFDQTCHEDYWRIAHATSQQRSEALCRTLWPERWEK